MGTETYTHDESVDSKLTAKQYGEARSKVAFQMSPYFVSSIGAGVSLQWKAAQIIELVMVELMLLLMVFKKKKASNRE